MVNDLIVIGGGAAGLCAAVYYKQQNKNASVRILESLPRVGKKLALTGNGRCNITNMNIDLSRYHGADSEFCRYALEKYDRFFTADFFKSIGVPIIFEGEKGFPASLQASSVVDCLRFAAEELGVITHLETPVTGIQISVGNYKILSNQLAFLAKKVIVATGGLAGGERLGCDGKMLEILKKAEFKINPTSPSIVQLKTETDIVKQLKGIKLDCRAYLKDTSNGKNITLRSDEGEVLFCDYGLSGPAILQISRNATQGECSVVLDIMPKVCFNELLDTLRQRAVNLKNRPLEEFFTGMLQKRVGQVLLKQIGCRLSETGATLNESHLKDLTSLMKKWTFKATGTTGYLNAQATAGGLSTDEFSDKTMESKTAKGLYCVGEALDIDGDCGGFNLQWAWSSAFCAIDAVLGVSNGTDK